MRIVGAWLLASLAWASPVTARDDSFMVFFDWNSADISRDAATILNEVVQTYREQGLVTVQLGGHSDRAGSSRDGILVSQRRAQAVREYLTSHGIPEKAISTVAYGEDRPLVETADGVREPQNRRVDIKLGLGAGQ